MQVYWLLCCMAEDLRGNQNHAAQSLRDACWEAAASAAHQLTTMHCCNACCDLEGSNDRAVSAHPACKPSRCASDISDAREPEMSSHRKQGEIRSDATPGCCAADSVLSLVVRSCGQGAQAGILLDQHRLKNIHEELGAGEGVTALVVASLNDLHAGGSGIVTSELAADAVPSWNQARRSLQRFETTAFFFERLSRCSSGLMQIPQEHREKVLQHRLKACNQKLLCAPSHAQV